MFPRSPACHCSRQVDARSFIFRAVTALHVSSIVTKSVPQTQLDKNSRELAPSPQTACLQPSSALLSHAACLHCRIIHQTVLFDCRIINVCSNCSRISSYLIYRQTVYIMRHKAVFLVLIQFMMFHCKLFKLPPFPLHVTST